MLLENSAQFVFPSSENAFRKELLYQLSSLALWVRGQPRDSLQRSAGPRGSYPRGVANGDVLFSHSSISLKQAKMGGEKNLSLNTMK